MNEKIKLLWDKAVTLVEQEPDGDWSLDTIKDKFAELIVEECVRQNKSYMINSTHRDFYLGWNDAIIHCNESIKEHFGVEE